MSDQGQSFGDLPFLAPQIAAKSVNTPTRLAQTHAFLSPADMAH
jgi:hypothetical protein